MFRFIGIVVVFVNGIGLHAQTPNKAKMPAELRNATLAVGQAAPDFALDTVDGKSKVKLSALRGKPVVLIFGSCT
jgi:cytochrome oxidase Cu insertion factor (SCO1/SenC/PrrC family)